MFLFYITRQLRNEFDFPSNQDRGTAELTALRLGVRTIQCKTLVKWLGSPMPRRPFLAPQSDDRACFFVREV